MDLKKYKYINNTQQLPKYGGGTPNIFNRDNTGNITGANWGSVADNTPWWNIQNLADNIADRGYNRFTEGPVLRSRLAHKSPVGTDEGTAPKLPEKTTRSIKDVDPITPTLGAIANQINLSTYEKSVEDKQQEANSGYTTVMGTQIKRYGNVTADDVSVGGSALSGAGTGAAAGAAIGSVVPGLGTALGGVIGGVVGGIGGLFGGMSKRKKAQRAAEEANYRINQINQFYSNKAKTDYLIENEKKNLFKYSKGKHAYDTVNPETMQTYRKKLVDTSEGVLSDNQNAWVGKGEWIGSEDGSWHRVNRGLNDTAPANLKNSDVVIRKEFDEIMPYAIATGQVDKVLQEQRKMQMTEQFDKHGLLKAKTGKLPKFKLGSWAIPAALGGLASISQYFNARNQSIKSPRTYMPNPYASRALDILNGLNINERPILRQLRDAEARGTYGINISGLTPAQKYIGRIAQTANTQTNIGNVMQQIQMQKNQLRSNYASSLLNAGQADRTAAMQANQWDLDYYSKAHAARQQGMQTGMYNFLNVANQAYANAFKKNIYDQMIPIWYEEAKNKRG